MTTPIAAGQVDVNFGENEMPNHVTNKLTFDATEAQRVFADCCPDGRFDFNALIPQPLQMYRGDLSGEDDEDFKCNWGTWNCENWGTKWNAYDCKCEVIDGKAVITFYTAWSVPYPVISAFANKFGAPFEHRYFDECGNFWGIEEWSHERGTFHRTKKQKSRAEDYKSLSIELNGCDPDADDEEVA